MPAPQAIRPAPAGVGRGGRFCLRPKASAGGFTLTEVMITVIVLSVLAAMILPDYSRSVARGHWRAARDVLWTIYAGEQVFQASNNTFVEPAAGCPNPPGAWLCIFMDDPNNGPVPVTFTVAGVTATTFTATATRAAPGGCGGWTLTINEQRVWGGSAPEEANVC